MATILRRRPSTSGITQSSNRGMNRKTSLSSFPSSRTPSIASIRNVTTNAAAHSKTYKGDSNGGNYSPSTPSPTSPPADHIVSNSHTRKLNSQYPANSAERHVEYILVASFDIEKGPTMEHQYPGAISGDENMLAELMLPDQAHVRNQDWTIFFLHKDTSDQKYPMNGETPIQPRRLPWKKGKKKTLETSDQNVDKWKAEAFQQDTKELEAGQRGGGDGEGEEEDESKEKEDRKARGGEEGGEGKGDEMEKEGDEMELSEKRNGSGEEGGKEEEEEEEEEEENVDESIQYEPQEGIDGVEGPPLIYVLNLVNTKQDASAKRGAIVKAMAICTRHPFLHIYKVPLLLLALEEYFKSPIPETLEKLYNAVNAMDLSLMPSLTALEQHVLQSSDSKDMFIEKFEQMIHQRMAEEAVANATTFPDSPTMAANEFSRLGRQYPLPRDTHEYETRVVYNAIPIPIKIPTAISAETVGDFSLIKLIQTFSGPHLSSPQPFMLHPLLTTSGAYTHPIMVLVNAILTQKRVIFLGHNRPSGEVAEAVLAACALVSGGILRGFTRHAFPYTDLTKIDDLLKVPGFIAGVTNPTFANHPEWWDLLCDLPAGRMKISHRIEQAQVTDGLLYFQQQNPTFAPNGGGGSGGPSLSANTAGDLTGDQAFMDDILRSIASRHGESVIRSKWRDYIIKFTRLAAAFQESVYGASALYIGASEADAGSFGVSGHGYVWPDDISRGKELGANVWRIEGWHNTRSFYSFIQHLAAAWGRKPIRKIDLGHQLDRLRMLKLSQEESGRIFLALHEAVTSYDEICQLLTTIPESHAGLFYLSLGLFHPEPDVRRRTMELLERIKEHEAGRHFWGSLGRFSRTAFARIKQETEESVGQKGGPVVGSREEGGSEKFKTGARAS